MQTYTLVKKMLFLKRNNALKFGKGKMDTQNDCIMKIMLDYIGFSHL